MSDTFGSIVSTTVDTLGQDNFRQGLYQVVAGGVALGLSGNAIGRELTAQGVGVGRGTLQAMVRTARATEQVGAQAGDVDLGAIPDASTIVQLPQGKAGTYRTQITVTFRQKLDDNLYSVEQTVWSVASDTPISPQDAIDIAQDIWGTHAALYGDRQLLGMQYTGTIQNTGRAA